MSYVALYRKWRPGTFDEVKGQDAICMTLKNQIISGRIGHAYLFCGTRGTGKTSVAKIMARAVNCRHPSDGNPCGVCAACRAISAGSSMNVQEVDAASNNGVDNIRDIREQVQYPPTEGKYRVFIIDEVHMLSPGAFNALLKTLEEPPAYVIFILATTEVNKIPVTVLSRCQRYDFHRITAEIITERLKELTEAENISVDPRALEYIARRADGAMRDALSLLDECVSFRPEGSIGYEEVLEILGAVDAEVFSDLFRALLAGRTGDALCILNEALEAGRETGQFVNDFLWYLRNLLLLKTSEEADRLIDSSAENRARMKADAAEASKALLMRYLRLLSELSNRMRYASQKRVLTELALIRLTSPEMDVDNDALLERITSLERDFKRLRTEGIGTAGPTAEGETQDQPIPQTAKTIALPKAEYEDFITIKNEWGKITNAVGGTYGAALRTSNVEPAGSGKMCIVFPDRGTQRFGGEENALKLLSRYVGEQYGKAITFETRVSRPGGEPVNSYVVTKEELEELVHFPVEEEHNTESGGR